MAGAGLQFALAVVFCAFVGNWIDGRAGSTPWGVVTGTLVGFAAGLYNILRMSKRENERADRERGSSGTDGPK